MEYSLLACKWVKLLGLYIGTLLEGLLWWDGEPLQRLLRLLVLLHIHWKQRFEVP